MENNKKIIVPTIIAVVTLVLLVFGATYAYFTIGSTNNFGTKELNATLEDMAGSVVLEQVEDTLSLNVTRAMMSEVNDKDTHYYASGSSTPANIAKMSVAGDGRYACDYTISVTKSATSPENDLYLAIRGQIAQSYRHAALSINKRDYNFNEENLFPITYSGTTYNITEDTPQYITANLRIANTDFKQNFLKGKDVTLTFEVTEFDCYLTEADESAPIYAIYDETEYCMYEEEGECYNWASGRLAFYQNDDEVNVGDTYDGYTVTNVYTNLNNTNYTSEEDVPWSIYDINGINVVEPIKPKNTAYWFSNCGYILNIDFLDTSEVTDMSYMFSNSDVEYLALAHFDTSNVTNMEGMFNGFLVAEVVDLSHFDTSNITNMSYMFNECLTMILGLSNWDTSKVTDMSYMFYDYWGEDLDLSNWNTSNVTNMESMFALSGYLIGDITRREVTVNGKTYIAWDTSKVTNMSSMFEDAGTGSVYSLDLTSWQVPLVTNYTNFNNGVEDKITPPIWVN